MATTNNSPCTAGISSTFPVISGPFSTSGSGSGSSSGSIFSNYYGSVSNGLFSPMATTLGNIGGIPARSNTEFDRFVAVLTESNIVVNDLEVEWDNERKSFILKLKLTMSDTVVCEMDKAAIDTNILRLMKITYDRCSHPETSATVTLELLADSPKLLDGDKILKFIFEVFPKIGEERIIDKLDSI